MSPPHSRRVNWLGPTHGPEFGPCYELLKAEAQVLPPTSRVAFALTVFAAPRPLADTGGLQAMVSDPSSGEVVQLLGVWCEGEGRTGRVVEGATRVFWHAFPRWWRARNEPVRPTHSSQPLRVRIETEDAALATALRDSLAAEGITAIWSRTSLVTGANAVVWDGRQLGGREADHLAAVAAAARWEAIPVVALLDFPRPETVAAARAIGAAEVFGKPLEASRLASSIRTLASSNPCKDLSKPAGPPNSVESKLRLWAA